MPWNPPTYESELNFTAVAIQSIPNFTGSNAPSIQKLPSVTSAHALEVKGVGATPTHWTVLLQGSISGKNWTTILSHSDTNSPAQADGALIWNNGATNQANWPTHCVYLRVNVTVLVLGSATSINIYALGRF
jgi:hypothetical protein